MTAVLSVGQCTYLYTYVHIIIKICTFVFQFCMEYTNGFVPISFSYANAGRRIDIDTNFHLNYYSLNAFIHLYIKAFRHSINFLLSFCYILFYYGYFLCFSFALGAYLLRSVVIVAMCTQLFSTLCHRCHHRRTRFNGFFKDVCTYIIFYQKLVQICMSKKFCTQVY